VKKVRGSCLCGAIVYEVPIADIGEITTCYCNLCRKNHGAERRLRAATLTRNFRWVKGEQFLSRFQHGIRLEKQFCRVCGTPLINRYLTESERFGLAIATLDQHPEKTAVRHDHVASKPDWVKVHDTLPTFDTVPDITGEVLSLERGNAVIRTNDGQEERVAVQNSQSTQFEEGDRVRASLAFNANHYTLSKVS